MWLFTLKFKHCYAMLNAPHCIAMSPNKQPPKNSAETGASDECTSVCSRTAAGQAAQYLAHLRATSRDARIAARRSPLCFFHFWALSSLLVAVDVLAASETVFFVADSSLCTPATVSGSIDPMAGFSKCKCDRRK
jgi:hypothetical protein